MSGRSVYDTPPDGDFARYVEELSQQSAARLLPARGGAPAVLQRASPRMARPAVADTSMAARGPGFTRLWQMLKLGLVLWIVYTVVSAVFPPLAVLGWPLLIFFAVTAATRLKSLPWADLAQTARREAEQKIQRPSRPQ